VRTGAFTSLIGVVASISRADLTSRGGELSYFAVDTKCKFFLDWMRFVHIVDPSIYDEKPFGIKINCFTKHHAEWLPTADHGDVVILRNVKVLSSSFSIFDKLSFLSECLDSELSRLCGWHRLS
jgi:hypothetical protein